MPNLPMITEPGFTFEDAAGTTVLALAKFQPYELAQLLAEAQNAADAADRAFVEAQNDIEFAKADPENDERQREHFVTWATRRRNDAASKQTLARIAAKHLFLAYGQVMGHL